MVPRVNTARNPTTRAESPVCFGMELQRHYIREAIILPTPMIPKGSRLRFRTESQAVLLLSVRGASIKNPDHGARSRYFLRGLHRGLERPCMAAHRKVSKVFLS